MKLELSHSIEHAPTRLMSGLERKLIGETSERGGWVKAPPRTYLLLYFFSFGRPYFESVELLETGRDSRFAIRVLIAVLHSSM